MTEIRSYIFLLALLLSSSLMPGQFTAHSAEVDQKLVMALKQAVKETSGFSNQTNAVIWLAEMSSRLERSIPDTFYRIRLLKTVHTEATRAGLSPELVLALIEIESAFDRFAVSRSGARGLMQVMPFWKKEIGLPRDKLFNLRTNLRYGCTILKYYLDMENGNVDAALARYNGSYGKIEYPTKVLLALNETWQLPAQLLRE